MTPRSRIHVAIIGLACLAMFTGCPSPEHTDRPVGQAVSAADSATAAAFRERGIEVPATRMTEAAGPTTTSAADLEALRVAIAEAKVLTDEEVSQLEQRGQQQAEPTTGEAPPPESPVVADSAPHERREAPRPDARPSAPPRVEAPQELAAPEAQKEEEAPAKMAMAKPALDDFQADGALEKKKDSAGGKDSDGDKGGAPKTVLKQIATAAREAKILVRDEDGKLVPLTARELRLVTYLQGPRARTVVDTVFENATPNRLEGTFYFPLPADASPAGFAMFSAAIPIDAARSFERGRSLPALGQTAELADLGAAAPATAAGRGPDWQTRQEARVVEQKRAREVYEEVVRHQVDPALLEWSGGNTFQARVFPIEPHALKRVVLVYEQTLPFDGQYLRYLFPLPARPLPVPISARVHVDASLAKPISVSLGKEGPVAVPRARADGPWQVFDLVQEDPGGALSVALQPADVRAQVLAGPDPGGLSGQTFFARLLPDVPGGERSRTGKALFVVDSSLSGEDNAAYELQSGMLEALLTRDDSITEYAVLLFDVRSRWLHQSGWRANTPESRGASLAELRRVYLEGATNFDALLTDLDHNLSWLAPAGAKPPTAFLLSDGQITWGQIELEALLRHPSVGALRWIAYRFGENAVNQALFDALARSGTGRTVTVLSAAEIPAAADAHRNAAAVIKGVRLEGAAVADLTLAGQPKLLFPGQELQLAGRLTKPGAARLVVEAELAGRPLRIQAAVPADTRHQLAPRAFGELSVRRLLALDDERLDRMIVALSQHYLLANARSSMLVLEDAASYEAFSLRDERVELDDLERLRKQEEDQRLEKLQGLDLDAASPLARSIVAGLRAAGESVVGPLRPQPLVEQPLAGGAERLDAEVAYRERRKTDRMDVMVYDAVARARALAGDTMGAVRALSCTVELRPQDTEALRLVGYALLAIGQYQAAAELFERARLQRPFEGQVFLEEALALDGAGRVADAVRRYEIVLARDWRRHDEEVKTVAAFHLARLLAFVVRSSRLEPALKADIERRLTELRAQVGEGEIDYQLTTHWSTDGIDIDLWVFEPDGVKCFYGNRETPLGGKLHWDITDGLGPELYHMRKAAAGEYVVAVHYYGNNSPRLAVPTALLLVADRDVFGPEDRYTRRIQMRMLPKRDAVLDLRRERF